MSTRADNASDPDAPAQLELFEGKRVQRYRIAPEGGIRPFASMDEDGERVKLSEGDTIMLQVEATVTHIKLGAKYKGGRSVGTRDRTAIAQVTPGSAQLIHVQPAPRAID